MRFKLHVLGFKTCQCQYCKSDRNCYIVEKSDSNKLFLCKNCLEELYGKKEMVKQLKDMV